MTPLRSTLRAFPTLLRIGFMDAVAYRAELLFASPEEAFELAARVREG